MSRLTNKDYKVSNIDQILNGVKTDKSFNEILDDNTRIRIENALHILADYEDLGSVEEFKDLKEKHYIITGGRSAGKLFTQKAVIEVLGYLKELEQKDQRIEELEKELADLKQNAIMPKFKSGSSLFSIEDNSWVCPQKNCVPVLFNNKIYYAFYIENEDDLIYNYGMEQNLIREENLFSTREEAEEKLNQMKGE